jgi:uncharacterized protein RhaS with RHS repeats
MRLRNYLPDLGRFSAPDPTGLVRDTINPYLYAENNPVRYNDPSGAQPLPVHAAGVLIGASTEVGGYLLEKAFDGEMPTWGGFILQQSLAGP